MNSNGLCECGCGEHAPIAPRNYKRLGWIKGKPQRFIRGHNLAHLRHGMSHAPEHNSYLGARQRCNNPNHKRYVDYGGRGIKFLFTSFEQFFAELGSKPSPGHTLDRTNNNGNYEPGNVRWALGVEQCNNRRQRRWKRKPSGTDSR